MLNRGGPLSKLVSGTVGLAKEYSADKKERKSSTQGTGNLAPPVPSGQTLSYVDLGLESNQHSLRNGDDSFTDDEEETLDLDEAQQAQSEKGNMPTHISNRNLDLDHSLESFLHRHSSPQIESKGLSKLVILPQRRPKSQHKGFVRAYAPVLEECDISQDTWLEFLDVFEASINKNGWFHVTNLAIMAAGSAAALTLGINPVLHMVAMAIHASVEVSRRGYLNYQQNKYLDVLNDQFFKPRGLYCMVIKYKPSSKEPIDEVDLKENISRSISGRDGQSQLKHFIDNSSMTMKSDMDMPDPAPLVFPGLDSLSEQQKTESIKHFGHVMQDYIDRRAVARFEAEYPDSRMPSAPRKEFASVYGDPNSTTNSGGFVSMISGGKINPVGPSGARHDIRRERRSARKAQRKEKKEKRALSKMLKSEALYLMVVNMPSREVMDSVGAELGRSAGNA